ncbi:MAG: carbamoyl-phosphate synthase domain-containing protein [Rubripirellula sp.]|nr:carbamoyl-phosphate synthase domain-containing protein [Rubripirellula sp.]
MKPAKLALEDGSIFTGTSFGAETEVTGEVVFNTAMTGYQEILTDPSYRVRSSR